LKTIPDVSLFLFLSCIYENADQFLSDAAEDVGIERIHTARLVSSGAIKEKFPFHHVIKSASSIVDYAKELSNKPVCCL